jgi:hypothetical protein
MKGIGSAERNMAGAQQQSLRLDVHCRREIETLDHACVHVMAQPSMHAPRHGGIQPAFATRAPQGRGHFRGAKIRDKQIPPSKEGGIHRVAVRFLDVQLHPGAGVHVHGAGNRYAGHTRSSRSAAISSDMGGVAGRSTMREARRSGSHFAALLDVVNQVRQLVPGFPQAGGAHDPDCYTCDTSRQPDPTPDRAIIIAVESVRRTRL